jgi:hypothetical protein
MAPGEFGQHALTSAPAISKRGLAVAEELGEEGGEIGEAVSLGLAVGHAKVMGADVKGLELAGQPEWVDGTVTVVGCGPGAVGE